MKGLLQRDTSIIDGPTQHALYELVSDCGEFFTSALRRDHHLLRGPDWPENWLELTNILGRERAQSLCDGAAPTEHERHLLIRWQVEHALEQEDPDVVATLWLCKSHDSAEIAAVEAWGNSITTELKFKWIGRYPDEATAIGTLRDLYIVSPDDIGL